MSIKSYNIGAKEQVAHSRTKRLPVIVGPDSYVDGGEVEEWNYNGPWSAMLAKFNGLTGSITKRLEATLTRSQDGAFGELRWTWTKFIKGSEGTSGDPEASFPGSQRDNPSYELTTSEANAPLLTSPKFASLSDEGLRAISMLLAGYAPTDMFDEAQTIGDVAQAANAELYKYVVKGITDYIVPRVTLTARYKSSNPVQTEAMTIQEPPGPFGKVKGDRNWLFVGGTQSYSNGEIWVTETYKLSGPNGWEEGLY